MDANDTISDVAALDEASSLQRSFYAGVMETVIEEGLERHGTHRIRRQLTRGERIVVDGLPGTYDGDGFVVLLAPSKV